MKMKLIIMASLFAIVSSISSVAIKADCDSNGTGRGCIDCQAACAAGRSVDRETCIQCNSCIGFSDEAKQECGETPF
ncbi:hypothetical protein HYX58_01250 [Candidatus Dependentiae bacterium]|nr:hypothetical protein [Candidatus Dependentiae bacterium]